LVNAIHAVNDGDAILTPRVTKEILSRGIPADMPHSQTKAMFDALSPRELDVASLVAEGLQNKEIGEMLTIQPESVKRMVNRVLRKLNLHSRIQIAVAWYKAGMKHSTDK
jgi:DNA-binding NarL/FixJ family response regulator